MNVNLRDSGILAVCYDVDGTLVDTNPIHEQAWVDAAKIIFGFTPDDDMLIYQRGRSGADAAGYMLRGAVKHMGLDFSVLGEGFDECVQQLRGRKKELWKQRRAGAALQPGVLETFEVLGEAGIRIYVCTSASHDDLEGISREHPGLAALFLRDRVIAKGDYSRSKPDAEPLQKALEMAGLNSNQMIYVGDAQSDFAAAINAGMVESGSRPFGYFLPEGDAHHSGIPNGIENGVIVLSDHRQLLPYFGLRNFEGGQ